MESVSNGHKHIGNSNNKNDKIAYVYDRLSSLFVSTFWTQSTQLESSAAVKPMMWKELSDMLQKTRPVTIGSSDAFTRQPVRWPSKKYVSTTVKNGADDLIVSVRGTRKASTLVNL